MVFRYLGARAATICSIVSICFLSGCSLDFDQFDESDPSQSNNENNVNNVSDMTNDVGGDGIVDPDMDVDMVDMGPTELPIGADCTDDADCGEGKVCADGYCSADCAAAECEEGVCIEWNGELRCAAACETGCDIEGRTDLSCLEAVGPDGMRASACLTDEDQDATSDLLDNCPGMANLDQEDLDADGVGDLCDTNRVCYAGADNGRADFGPFTFGTSEFSLPDYAVRGRIPLVGGRDAAGELVDEVWWLDLNAQTLEMGAQSLPYPSVDFGVAHNGNGFVLTPGATIDDDFQEGRFIVINAREIAVERSFQRTVSDPTMLRTSDGRLWLHGFDDPTTTRWRVFYFDEERQEFVQSTTGTGNRRAWYAATDSTGRGYFYSQGRNLTQSGYLIQMEPGNTSVNLRGIDLPDVTDPFDPIMIPGPGDTLWLWERQTGQAWVYDFPNNDFTRAIDFDLLDTSVDRRYVSLHGGPGFVVLSRPAADSDELNVSIVSLPCLTAANSFNRDGDSIPDVRDNCPIDDNEGQDATDDDLLGDVCDPDDDGDEISDGADVIQDMMGNDIDLSQDSDNDGEPNTTDTDDDNDGIPDAADRYALDTDNDNARNAYDIDDDEDGYFDSLEGVDGSRQDQLQIPNAGFISFVRETANGRTVELAEFNLVREATQPLTATDPHQPRLWSGAQYVMTLDGPPDTATSLTWTDRLMGTSLTYDIGVPIRAADPSAVNPPELAQFFVTTAIDQTSDWKISVVDLTFGDTTVMLQDYYTRLPQLGGLDYDQGRLLFDGAQNGCTNCSDLWTIDGGTFATRVNIETSNPSNARLKYSRYAWIGDAEDGGRTSFSSVLGFGEHAPPGVTDVNSAIATINNDLIVSAQDASGTYNLYFYNSRVDEWFLLLESDDNLIEVDWTD